jgi:hypothetical protein
VDDLFFLVTPEGSASGSCVSERSKSQGRMSLSTLDYAIGASRYASVESRSYIFVSRVSGGPDLSVTDMLLLPEEVTLQKMVWTVVVAKAFAQYHHPIADLQQLMSGSLGKSFLDHSPALTPPHFL